MMRWIIATIFAFLLAPTAAYAWGDGGHYTICEIAYLNLTPAAKAKVDRLVALADGYDSFTESCTFPDRPVSRASEHYVVYLRTDRPTDRGCPGDLPCVIGALRDDLAILRSNATDAEKARAILYIGHWFGDLHQPLHISFGDDRGGNSIRVRGPCPGSLHSVWDTCIVERRIFGPGTDRLPRARAAAATLNSAITASQRREWTGSEPWQWAGESFQVTTAAETGYCVVKGNSCWYSDARPDYASGDPQRTLDLDDSYLDRASPIVEDRLRRAGIRLADALNRSFDSAYRGFGQ